MNYQSSIEESILEYIKDGFPLRSNLVSSLLKSSLLFKRAKRKGFSKFGGKADLPDSCIESLSAENLSFLCQISLSEFSCQDQLIDKGILYFFIKSDFKRPIKNDDCKVVYTDEFDMDKEDLKERADYRSTFINFKSSYNFPSYQSQEILELEKMGVEVYDQIEDLQEVIDSEMNQDLVYKNCYLFGNPKAIQGDVKLRWACRELGYRYPFSDKERLEISELQKEYELLLQVDLSNIKIEGFFNEGLFYFGMKREDIINRNFDHVLLEYQSN